MSKTSCIYLSLQKPVLVGYRSLPLPPQLRVSCTLYTEPPPHMTLSVDHKLEQVVIGGLPGDRGEE